MAGNVKTLPSHLFQRENRLTVNQIHHPMEFRNRIMTTGVNIPQKMAEHMLMTVLVRK